MLGPWRRQPVTGLRARVEASIKEGIGLSKQEWILAPPIRPADLTTLGEAVVDWSRVRTA